MRETLDMPHRERRGMSRRLLASTEWHPSKGDAQ